MHSRAQTAGQLCYLCLGLLESLPQRHLHQCRADARTDRMERIGQDRQDGQDGLLAQPLQQREAGSNKTWLRPGARPPAAMLLCAEGALVSVQIMAGRRGEGRRTAYAACSGCGRITMLTFSFCALESWCSAERRRFASLLAFSTARLRSVRSIWHLTRASFSWPVAADEVGDSTRRSSKHT